MPKTLEGLLGMVTARNSSRFVAPSESRSSAASAELLALAGKVPALAHVVPSLDCSTLKLLSRVSGSVHVRTAELPSKETTRRLPGTPGSPPTGNCTPMVSPNLPVPIHGEPGSRR
jgi:hypothetical protein